jgi:hypothetical protein
MLTNKLGRSQRNSPCQMTTVTSLRVGKALLGYVVANSETPLAAFRLGLASVASAQLCLEQSPTLRLEVRRRAAEYYCSECLTREAPWPVALESLLELEALGYTNVDRRAHFAFLLCKYAEGQAVALPAAEQRVKNAQRRVGYLGRRSRIRSHYEPLLSQLYAQNAP